ncbi:MAG: ATP-binding protein [Chloroflexi bacterium]|nr:ATP-binding protein [Chloroflexota bacterium]
MADDRLGLIVEGSLVDGLRARLDGLQSIEDVRVGQFVRVTGRKHDYFCLVTDVRLDSTSHDMVADPPVPDDLFALEVLAGTTAYGALAVQPMLMLARDGSEDAATEDGPRPVRTIPPHFAEVFTAAEGDFDRVFGAEADHRFEIGQPLDMDVPVRLDLKRFVERSNGVFGKSGTGKSFLTRLLLCGVVTSGAAVNLIFDMHSEYGWTSQSEGGYGVKGLKPLFGSRVQVYTLDPRSTTSNDGLIKIGLNEIEIEDIELLADELRLNATAVESAALCESRLGRDWIAQLTDEDVVIAELNGRVGAHEGSLSALQRKLLLIRRLPFVQPHVSDRDSGLDRLLAALGQRQHVVLEFGQHNSLLAYMLAANVITRRIHREWTKKVEAHKQGGGQAPPQLTITIEEAHKFLNSRAANQTIFGTIARELRKYNVTLLVVDQRPSGIDDEVLSQIGTRITCALNDDKDIEAVLAGVSGAGHLRSILASLDSRQQAMILGHAVPMPMALRTRTYDETFYAWVAEAASKMPRLVTNDRPWGQDPIATSVKPTRKYQDLFPDDE